MWAACGSGATRQPTGRSPVPESLRPYLVEPAEGYPLSLGADSRAALETAYREGVLAGRPELARAAASQLLARDPDLGPALVLQAQAALLDGSLRQALEWAASAAESSPEYVAAQLAVGRASEELGEIGRAYAAFSAVSQSSDLAARRATELAPRVGEILVARAHDALARGRQEEALQDLHELQRLEPGSRRSLELAAAVHRAGKRPQEELEALSALVESGDADPEVRIRRAELEVEVGDPARGLETLEALLAELPDRAADLQPRIERAKFFWRLRNLPGEVQEVLGEPELTRGDFAVLLYWLVPSVRSGVAQEGRIATDILDHPQRQRIARVVNLGLMDLDPGVRRFDPDRPVRRSAALTSILRLLARTRPPAACAADWAAIPRPSIEATCESAVACGLLVEASDCLPSAPVPAATALEWLRLLTSG